MTEVGQTVKHADEQVNTRKEIQTAKYQKIPIKQTTTERFDWIEGFLSGEVTRLQSVLIKKAQRRTMKF